MRKRIHDLFTARTEFRTQKMYHAGTLCAREGERAGRRSFGITLENFSRLAELRTKLARAAAPECNRGRIARAQSSPRTLLFDQRSQLNLRDGEFSLLRLCRAENGESE